MEIWKDIDGTNGNYRISSHGRVFSVRRNICLVSVSVRGYQVVSLYRNGKQSEHKVHRLVAQAFIPNPYNKQTVNHLDENKKNNRADNLQWATTLENNNHGTRMERANNSHKHPISQYTITGDFICEWDSNASASKALNISKGNIWSCCTGKYKHAGGFIWKYSNEIGGGEPSGVA